MSRPRELIYSNKTYYDKRHYSPDRVAKILRRKIWLTDVWHRLLLHLIEKHSIRLDNSIVLEVGCGLGGFCRYLTIKRAQVLGVDISSSVIKYAQRICKNVEASDSFLGLVIAEAEKLPIRSETFDAVVCSETLEHTSDIRVATTELARVCKSEGKILITIPNVICQLCVELLRKIFRLGQPEIMTNYIMLRRLIKATELRIVDEAGIDFFPTLLLSADLPDLHFSSLIPQRLRESFSLQKLIAIVIAPKSGFFELLAGTVGFLVEKKRTDRSNERAFHSSCL